MVSKTVHDPKEVSRALARIVDRLSASQELAEAFLAGTIRDAQQKASLRPSPQAPMAAAGLHIERGSRLGLSSLTGGSPAAEVAIGSEFGSGLYRQFGPRNPRGNWLFPAIEAPSPGTMQSAEAEVDSVIAEEVARA